MKQYLDLLKDVLDNGTLRNDRTGTGTISVFDRQIRFDLQDGFPAVTTKKLAFRSMIGELLWFINGETHLSELRYRTFGDYESNKKTIWDANQADFRKRCLEFLEDDIEDWCGKIYGSQWNHDNQLIEVVERIKTNPTDRRLLVSAWNVDQVNNPFVVSLPPCHYAFQFYVRDGKYLDLKWHQRSVDLFLGLPFNIASYAALCIIVASITGLAPGRLTGDLGDCHIYSNHVDQVKEQLSRETFDNCVDFVCNKELRDMEDLMTMTANDFALLNYQHHDTIKAKMAV